MELTGQVAINASRERVWAALNDAVVLQACIPGCEELVDESATVRQARVMVKLGPVRARFRGKVTLSDVVPPERCVIGFEGSGGAAGMASGRSQVELHEDGGTTRLAYSVKAALGGKLGQIGGRMIDASAKQLADQFFEALRAQIAQPQEQQASMAAAVQGLPEAGDKSPASVPVAAVERGAPICHASMLNRIRIQWFALGGASMACGVWLGKVLF